MDGDVLTPKETRLRIGMSATTFRKYELAGKFRQLQIARPVGRFRYSRLKVEQFVNGQSLARVS